MTKSKKVEISHNSFEARGSDDLLDYVPMEKGHEQSQPRCSDRERIPCCLFEIEGEAFMIDHDEEEPKTIQQALSSSKAKEWFEAMEEEMNSMKSNQVWDLVYLLPCRKTTGNKWVLNIKHKEDGC